MSASSFEIGTMKTVLLIIVWCSFFLRPAIAQWEHLQLPDDYPPAINQYNNILIGCAPYDYYRSTDFGRTWSLFNTGLPATSKIFSSSMHFYNGKLYITSYGLDQTADTVLRSAYYYCNLGDTSWSVRYIRPIRGVYPFHTSVIFLNNDTVFAGFTYNNDSLKGFYLSTDGGTTWAARDNKNTPASAGYDYSLVGKRMYTCDLGYDTIHTQSYLRWYYSDDLALSWIHITFPIPDSVGVTIEYFDTSSIVIGYTDLNSASAISANRIFLRSTDQGHTWDTLTVPGIMAYTHVITRYLIKLDNILTWGFETQTPTTFQYSKYISLDNGSHWKAMPFDDSSNYYAYGYGHDNEIYIEQPKVIVKTDSSFSDSVWVPFIRPSPTQQQLLGASGTHVYVTYLMRYIEDMLVDTLYHSPDNGTTWEKQPFYKGYGVVANAPWYHSTSGLYACAMDTASDIPQFLKSTDNGVTWSEHEIRSGPMVHQDYCTVEMVSGDTIILQGVQRSSSNRELVRSLDGGMTWEFLHIPTRGLHWSCMPKQLVILGDGHFYISYNLGESWEQQQFSMPPPLEKAQVQGFTDGRHYFYTSFSASNYAPPVYTNTHSMDNGNSWQPISIPEVRSGFLPALLDRNALYGMSYSTININDPYEGAMDHCYFSLDSGASWKAIPGGFYDVTSLMATPEYLYGYGNGGVWRYKLNGLSVPFSERAEEAVLTAYPNPAASEIVHISYNLSRSGLVKLSVYDIKGARITTLIEGNQSTGQKECSWNTKEISPGSYLLKLEAEGRIVTTPITLIK